MKTLNIYLMAAIAVGLAVAAGCGDTTSDEGNPDGGGSQNPCEINPTCAKVINNGKPEQCIADFGFESTQAGKYIEKVFDVDVYKDGNVNSIIGFYGYNDKTDGATMIPVPNNEGSEDADNISATPSCDTRNSFAMHLQVNGFKEWGAGVGLEWGGPDNANCDSTIHPGVENCLAISLDNNKFNLAETMAKSECQGSTQQETDAFIHCLKYGKIMKNIRDLSQYKGIGVWIMQGKDNMATSITVGFPIPETARFLAELHGGSPACDEDVQGQECFNDFSTTIRLDASKKEEWTYHEVLFKDLNYATSWGFKPTQYTTYPKDRSLGFKFQIDKTGTETPYADLYFDDIVLIP